MTPEYQAIFEAGLASQREGGQGNDPRYGRLPQGMPRDERALSDGILIAPKATHILFENPLSAPHLHRRAHWPKEEF